MPFTPLIFQSALAVGGVALMPFVLMQFTFAHAGKLVTVRDLAGGYDAASLFLVPVMLVSTLLHFFLIAQMSIEFLRWARKRRCAAGLPVGPCLLMCPTYYSDDRALAGDGLAEMLDQDCMRCRTVASTTSAMTGCACASATQRPVTR